MYQVNPCLCRYCCESRWCQVLDRWFTENLLACCLSWIFGILGVYIAQYAIIPFISSLNAYSNVALMIGVVLLFILLGFVLGRFLQQKYPRCRMASRNAVSAGQDAILV